MSSSIPTSAGASGDDPRPARGQLKLFLGYAAGVGKTYRMLEEAQQLKREGKDIVIGYFEPHGRKGHNCQNRWIGNDSDEIH